MKAWLVGLSLIAVVGCGGVPMRNLPPLLPGQQPIYREVAGAGGLDVFSFRTDEIKAKVIATMGGGLALADYDRDGDLDVYLVNSKPKMYEENVENCSKLFENDGTGRFTEVTIEAGVEHCGWGNGVFWIDLESDGDVDLLLTGFEANRVWLNETAVGGRPRFRDVTDRLNLGGGSFCVAVNGLDYDRDGLLDLYVANYLQTTLDEEANTPLEELRVPEDYPPLPSRLLRNIGLDPADGLPVYVDVTEEAGAANPEGKSLAAAILDWNDDGWPDVFVANDRTPNSLLTNGGRGADGVVRFTDTAVESGVAYSAFGKPPSGMGVWTGDLDSDDRPDIFVTNFANEWNSLYWNVEGVTFEDATERSGLGRPSYEKVGWGTVFTDYDNDGRDDIALVNGGLLRDVFMKMAKYFAPKAKYQQYAIGEGFHQHALLFHNEIDPEAPGDLEFRDVTDLAGDFGRPLMVARGLATGDVDGDGDLDLLVSDQDGPPRLFLNQVGQDASWVRVDLRPGAAGRTVYGARIRITHAGGDEVREWYVQPSYGSGSATPLHFGLGAQSTLDRVEVDWPDGTRSVAADLDARRTWVFTHGLDEPEER